MAGSWGRGGSLQVAGPHEKEFIPVTPDSDRLRHRHHLGPEGKRLIKASFDIVRPMPPGEVDLLFDVDLCKHGCRAQNASLNELGREIGLVTMARRCRSAVSGGPATVWVSAN